MINYGTLIFALFEKLDNSRDTKSFDENILTSPLPELQRKTRHLKEKVEHNLVGLFVAKLKSFFRFQKSLQAKIFQIYNSFFDFLVVAIFYKQN